MSTMTQILDEMEPDEDLEMLVASCMGFTLCPECGHVDGEEEDLMNHPCQKCGTIVQCRRILFSTEGRLLEMICECYKSERSNELCVLLFCALIEQHLVNLLKSRCIRLGIDWSVMKLLLEANQNAHERLKLFEQLTGVKPREALAGQPAESVLQTYESLRKKRNWIAHGVPGAIYGISKEDIKAAVNSAADSFSCFAFLHHKYCAVDSPPMPADE
jgi:hypothetical protein